MLFINCQKLDLFESLQRSIFKVQRVRKRSNLGILLLFVNFVKRSGLAHFPITILFSSNEVLPKFALS